MPSCLLPGSSPTRKSGDHDPQNLYTVLHAVTAHWELCSSWWSTGWSVTEEFHFSVSNGHTGHAASMFLQLWDVAAWGSVPHFPRPGLTPTSCWAWSYCNHILYLLFSVSLSLVSLSVSLSVSVSLSLCLSLKTSHMTGKHSTTGHLPGSVFFFFNKNHYTKKAAVEGPVFYPLTLRKHDLIIYGR